MDPTAFVIPCLLAGVALYALTRRVDVYAALTQGAGEGLAVVAKILPALVGLLTAVYMLRASGAMDALAAALAPVLGLLGIPPETAALLLVLVLLGGMAYFTVSVLHLITQLAVNSACDLMQLKINAAVSAATAQVQGDYYTYRTDADGIITAVSVDTERVGQVSSLVLERMMDGDDGQVELDIPLETLFGVNFLPGLKLPLPVRILVLTTSDVSYHNELMSAAINQSKYQLYLNVKMDLDILVPWEHQAETVGTNVLLAETVIVGKVPQTYVEVE